MPSSRQTIRCWRQHRAALCGDCHRQYAKDNPNCIATADYFHKTITQMDDARNKFGEISEKLAAKGLDVEPISNQLTELTDNLKKSRTYVHSFSRDTFQQVALPGEEAVQRTGALVDKAREEYKYRQIGLAVSIALIGLLMLAIYLKLRQLEKCAKSTGRRKFSDNISHARHRLGEQ